MFSDFAMKLLVAVAILFVVVEATPTRKCGTQDAPKEGPFIKVSPCPKLPCRFRRKSTVQVEFKFNPEKDVPKVVNSVHAKILGIPFPFIGVHERSNCGKIFDMKGAKVSCPLKAGQEYVYKDSFNILEAYPKVKVWVHWALLDQDGKDILCFEAPVKITN